ncbi:MAG: ArnT family glycosyltransferase [Aggregatilineales bacterium]
MPYWLEATLTATPAFAGVFFGLGLPWALAALPRRQWRDWPAALCLALAFGPALLTAWMFILGTLGAAFDAALLRADLVLAGAAGLAVEGWALVWLRRRPPDDPPRAATQLLAWDERLLLALIAVALVVRWLAIAYWPFTAYDALWVYGYEGRLYALLGHIPHTIGYYPQFLPLQFAFGQLIAGGIDDHAARAGLIFVHAGSILAAYTLGTRLFSRRVGLLTAALWALYHHVGAWARFGDLEIPLTFLFTAAAAFFLSAWTGRGDRRRDAVIAGLLLGIALWTKPTAGAFVWGVLLLAALALVRTRFDWRAWRPRLEAAPLTGLAAAPLGGVWYIRNVLLGHNAVDFPPGFWLTQAARSGAEFGWPLLGLLAFTAFAYLGPLQARPNRRAGLAGLALALAALLPSTLFPQRMGAIEYALLAASGFVSWRTLVCFDSWPPAVHAWMSRVGWAQALALPYFVTWFYSYSYHYRLSFAIVPLLMLPTTAVLGGWVTAERVARWRALPRLAWGAALVALALPGIVAPLYDVGAGWNWLWTDKLPDDNARYRSGNAALMAVVDGLRAYEAERGQTPAVAAPGVLRLPFFFPTADIRVNAAPTRLRDLEGVTYFVEGAPEGAGAYDSVPLTSNQVLGALAQGQTTVPNITRRAWWHDDGIFRYVVYELHTQRRFQKPDVYHDPAEPVVFGDTFRFRGHGIGADTFWPGRPVYLQLYWETLRPPDRDYTIYVHLRDADDQVRAAWDGPVTSSADGRYYSTLVWEPGEFVADERLLRLAEGQARPGEGYSIVIGFYDLQTNERLPVTVGGVPAGDGFRLNERLRVLAQPPA